MRSSGNLVWYIYETRGRKAILVPLDADGLVSTTERQAPYS